MYYTKLKVKFSLTRTPTTLHTTHTRDTQQYQQVRHQHRARPCSTRHGCIPNGRGRPTTTTTTTTTTAAAAAAAAATHSATTNHNRNHLLHGTTVSATTTANHQHHNASTATRTGTSRHGYCSWVRGRKVSKDLARVATLLGVFAGFRQKKREVLGDHKAACLGLYYM